MDDQRVGGVVRTLRHRLSWRQADVAAAAGATQDDVSRLERGRIGAMSVDKVRRSARALDAEIVVSVRWRGGEVDRLLDQGHAAIVEWVASMVGELGWVVAPEVSVAFRGERGSIDLAWHPATRSLLVIEVKTELTSLEETLRRHDVKQRVASQPAAERFGWTATDAVCRMLVLPDRSSPRRRVARFASVLDAAYRLRGAEARKWLAAPAGGASLLVFAPLTHGARVKRGTVSQRRVRAGSSSVARQAPTDGRQSPTHGARE